MTRTAPLRVLVAEDDALHAELIQRALERTDGPLDVVVCRTLREARERMATESPALVLADLKLPDGSGTDLLPPAGAGTEPEFPVILMTSYGNEHTAVEALKRGALDYLVKSESIFADLPRIAARALRAWSLVTERRRAETALRDSEERFRTIASEANDAIVMCDPRGDILFWNDAAVRMFGYPAAEALRSNVRDLLGSAPSRPAPTDAAIAFIANPDLRRNRKVETVVLRKDGRPIDVEVSMSVARMDEQWTTISIVRDITDRKQAEAELRASEEKYRLLVEDLNEAVFALDAGGRVTYVSRAIQRLLGYTPDDILGRSPLDFVHPEDLVDFSQRFTLVLAGGPDPTAECRVIAKSGETRWMRTVARHVITNGMVTGLRGLLRDITESRNIDERLRLTQFSLDHAGDPVFWIGPDGAFYYANVAACRSLQLPLDRLLSLSVSDIDPSISGERWRHFWNRTKRKGSVTALSMPWQQGAHVAYIDLTSTYMEFGGRPYLCVFARDATERHRLEEQLRQAQKMEAIGRLAGGVAHDFNNHLFAINLFADMLARELADNRKLAAQVVEIKQAAEQAARLTQHLLAFSRQQVLKPEVLELGAELSRIHAMLRRIIGEDITLRVTSGETPTFIEVDPTQLHQVLLNLVVNARDAMPNAGTITIKTSRELIAQPILAIESDIAPGAYVELSVSDTGVGMSREVLSAIFDPFFTTKDKSKGTGLGLSMVLGVVKQSRGHILVDSEPGAGSRFRIFFPEAPRPDARARTESLPQKAPSGSETILLVEDEEPVRRVLYTALTGAGYRVIEADNGLRAIEKALAFGGPIHLLLTDVVMPEMNGADLAKALGARQPEMKTLFMSGYVDLEALGFASFTEGTFLQKPCALDVLLHHVRRLLDT